MSGFLHLFPDTNLFLQCRALEELDWSPWREFDEVHLIVSLPVQREIDNHKKKGNGRLGRRGRATNTFFREIMRGGQDHKVIRESDPHVKLFIRSDYGHNPALADRMNYEERDDQLIGTISTFLEKHLGADARLLTDDTTPIATAKSVGIAVAEIPEFWLLPPEGTESEKKIGALEAELSRLKRAEPQFKIACLNATGEQVKKLEYALQRFEALTTGQIAELMKRITERFPLETDFGPRESAERQPQPYTIFATKEVFVPATDKELAAYRDQKYPQWLKACEDILRKYHGTLNHQFGLPRFCFVAVNEGTRPGNDALVTIKAKGDFVIMPPLPKTADDNDDEEDAAAREHGQPVELPPPPVPPRGKWRTEPSYAFATLESLQSLAGLGGHDPLRIHRRLPIPRHFRRDPNSFYYKPERPVKPQSSFSLECEQWRHSGDAEPFPGEIYFARSQDEVAGALECEIHAGNLSQVTSLLVPLRITIASTSVLERAQRLVEALTGSPPAQRSQTS